MNLHIFLNFIPRQDHPYQQIIEELQGLPDTKVATIDLPASLFEVTRRVEYSLRKYFRFFYYGQIYSYLSERINQLLDAHPGPTIVYTSDEGVWTEFIKQILHQRTVRRPLLVNVQHGLHFLESPSRHSVFVRRIINTLCRATAGFPIYGYGLGGSGCDIYLVYGEQERKFLEAMGCRAVVAGNLIKAPFLSEVSVRTPEKGPRRVALFALQPISKEAGFKRTAADFYSVLRPVATQLASKYGYHVVYRPHPGMDLAATRAALESAGLLLIGEVQDTSTTDITQAIAEAEMVLSHSSTVLLEALLANRISVQLLEYEDSKRLHLPINFICLAPELSLAGTDYIMTHTIRIGQSPEWLGINSWSQYVKQELTHKS